MAHRALFPAILAALVWPASASAQSFGNEWVSFTEDPTRLSVGAPISDSQHEVDFAWGDLDLDGLTDLVVVRKEPWSTAGKRTNLLLMNEGGILVDRTATYASASDVPLDQGFLTPTNDRDAVLVDIDQDGWLDVVTSATISVGDPKHLGHPRVYRNLGEDGSGNWLGLRFENGRIPQLVAYSSGLEVNPNFCSVAASDVTGDGFPDLYFVDYDSSVTNSFVEDPAHDTNDRLLVNDGRGYFTDESQSRISVAMLESDFGTHGAIVDLNLDGAADIVKDNALLNYAIRATYNDPGNVGFFAIDDSVHTTGNPYDFDVGDMNKDRRADILVSSDGSDVYRYNLATDALGRAIWGPDKAFEFLAGDDDGFAGNNLIVDLDNDGWKDAIVTDVDVDVLGCDRRANIYHNPGGVPGAQISLVEERQQAFGGWVGVGGIFESDLQGTHDVAVFDIDGDGAVDIILGRCTGTSAWINQGPDARMTEYCIGAPNSGGAGGGGALIDGTGSSSIARNDLALEVTGAPPSKPGLFFYGPNRIQTAFGDGYRCVGGMVFRVYPTVFTDDVGFVRKPIDNASPPSSAGQLTAGSTWSFQLWYRDPKGAGRIGLQPLERRRRELHTLTGGDPLVRPATSTATATRGWCCARRSGPRRRRTTLRSSPACSTSPTPTGPNTRCWPIPARRSSASPKCRSGPTPKAAPRNASATSRAGT